MDAVQARTALEAMVAWDSSPVLSVAEVTDLLTLARRSDASGTPATIPTWQASQRYIKDQFVKPTVANGHRYKVAEDGTSGTAEPAWPTIEGGTVTDGDIVWREDGSDTWVPTWDLNTAAAEGWRRKAAKVAGAFDFSTDGQSFSRSRMHAHCLEMARMYATSVGSAFTVQPR